MSIVTRIRELCTIAMALEVPVRISESPEGIATADLWRCR
jgi:hypothetical protein